MDNLKESDIEFVNEARIMSFLRGEMTAEEETKFKEDVAHDPKLKADAINLARIAKGMKQVGEEKDLMLIKAFLVSGKGLLTKEEVNEDIFQERVSYGPKENDRGKNKYIENTSNDEVAIRESQKVGLRKLSVWLSIAASLAILVWLGIGYHSYKSTTSLGDEYCNAISSGVIVRGSAGESRVEKSLSDLFVKVQTGDDLDVTIHQLSECWKQSNKEFYNEYTNYSTEIGWYLAIAYLKDNDKKKAKVVLEKLSASTEKDSAINKKVKELLEKL